MRDGQPATPRQVSTLHLAIAADRRYLRHAAVMLRSVSRSAGPVAPVVHLLHGDDLRDRHLGPLRTMLAGTGTTLLTHPIAAEAIDGLPSWGRIPTTMWYRVLLPDLLPDVDRILYLDVDVLICDSLAGLLELDLSGHHLAAVTNVPQEHRMGHAAELGLPGPRSYFNSGVLLMNLRSMRDEGVVAALLEVARRRRQELLWPDQDALNLVLADRRLPLHPRYNLMNSIRLFPWAGDLFAPGQVAEAVSAPAIVHFEGPADNKPWHLLSTHPQRELYRRLRRDTPWPRYVPSGLTPGNLVRLVRGRVRSDPARLKP